MSNLAVKTASGIFLAVMFSLVIIGCSSKPSPYYSSVPTEPPYAGPPVALVNQQLYAYNAPQLYYNPAGYSEPPMAAVNPPPAVYDEPPVSTVNPPPSADDDRPLYEGPPVSAVNPSSPADSAPAVPDQGPSNANLPDGSDSCIEGFVRREAFPGDHVCVTPYTRSKVAIDNNQAFQRRQSGGGAYGPDTCLQGFVWREAGPNDHICVTPETRTQTAYDNSQAAVRRTR